jgi:nucleoside-diphosphate-sugar epimerase
MSRVVVIGGSGHVGTYLVPALVEQGHDVVMSAEDRRQGIGGMSHGAKSNRYPSTVRPKSETADLLDASLSFGRILWWTWSHSSSLAITGRSSAREDRAFSSLQHALGIRPQCRCASRGEDDPLNPFGEYGINKAQIETWLLHEARCSGFPATIFRPGHIVGPGWAPINPLAHANVEVFSRMARGEELALPNLGLETIHHVHAADVAKIVLLAIANRSASIAEVFNAVFDKALNLRGYAEAIFRWFGFEPKLRYIPIEEWKKQQSPEDAHLAWEHIARSSCLSIDKARRRLGYEPSYTSLSAVQEAVSALIARGDVQRPLKWG